MALLGAGDLGGLVGWFEGLATVLLVILAFAVHMWVRDRFRRP